MIQDRTRPVLGILGGMGALASAEFLKTIYEFSPGQTEQDAPIVALYSDPTFPDRTEAFLGGTDADLLERLLVALAYLRHLGASQVVICCMTMHYLLPKLPPAIRTQVISLLDVIFGHLRRSRKRHLLICSVGTRKLQLFQNHPQWNLTKDRVLFPDEDDQKRLHEMILEVKRNRGIPTLMAFIEALLKKHHVDSYIAGCTEIHLVARSTGGTTAQSRGYECVDPLAMIAREWTARRKA